MIRGTSHHSVREIESLRDLISGGQQLYGTTIQNVDLRQATINWKSLEVQGCVFLGCDLSADDALYLISAGATIFPAIDHLPYNSYRDKLYTWQELSEEATQGVSRDLMIYEHFSNERFSPSVTEALYQRIHDHAIDDALRDFLGPRGNSLYDQRCVGIMGGHSTLRTDSSYAEVVRTAHALACAGYTVVSGGGPGTMEAANLGAYLSAYPREILPSIMDRLSEAPHYTDAAYNRIALSILSDYDRGAESLAIPTWFYGHEPSNVFATHIAKYFSNSIREDNLLALCLHGIVFAAGSAGTTQEIFQDAAQNHYVTYDYISPMVFLGRERYTQQTKIYQTIQQLSQGYAYHDYIHLCDEATEVVRYIKSYPPLKA